MKKSILIFALTAIAATGAFAQVSYSAGAGFITDMSFGNGFNEDIKGSVAGYNISASSSISMRNLSFGTYIFFDATYVEGSLSYATGSLKLVYKEEILGESDESETKLNVKQIGFTALGKYPIDIGVVTIFPLLGISYNIMISGKDEFGRNIIDISEFNQFGVLGGAGLDYKLNNNLYIRGQVMLQMRFANKAMKDIVASEKKEAEALKNIPGIATDIKTTLGLGPVIRISVGTRF